MSRKIKRQSPLAVAEEFMEKDVDPDYLEIKWISKDKGWLEFLSVGQMFLPTTIVMYAL